MFILKRQLETQSARRAVNTYSSNSHTLLEFWDDEELCMTVWRAVMKPREGVSVSGLLQLYILWISPQICRWDTGKWNSHVTTGNRNDESRQALVTRIDGWEKEIEFINPTSTFIPEWLYVDMNPNLHNMSWITTLSSDSKDEWANKKYRAIYVVQYPTLNLMFLVTWYTLLSLCEVVWWESGEKDK